MSVIETIYPDNDVATGQWTPVGAGSVYSCIFEHGSHDGDSTYAQLQQYGVGTKQSEFEVSLDDPSSWLAPPQVRKSEAWNTSDGQVASRKGESWRGDANSIRVINGGSWKFGVPQIVVRCTARRADTDPDVTTFVSGTLKLKAGSTVLVSTALSLGANYGETTLVANVADLLAVSPGDLRVAVEGVCQSDSDSETAELRVTQVKVELND